MNGPAQWNHLADGNIASNNTSCDCITISSIVFNCQKCAHVCVCVCVTVCVFDEVAT
jgi:hypothetical protein